MAAQTPSGIRGYAICTCARSGSNYLSQLLASTGQLGNAEEYFNGEGRRMNGRPDYPDDPEAQLQAITTMGASPNGVYGLKIFANHFDAVAAHRWPLRLPNLSFVHLERHDLLGQAISLTRALQTKQFRSTHRNEGQPAYDPTQINNHMVGLVRDNARWRFWFARNGLEPVRLTYESVLADPAGAVRAIAEKVGLAGHLTIDLSQVSVEIQRDEINEDWRRRFLTESYDPATFD